MSDEINEIKIEIEKQKGKNKLTNNILQMFMAESKRRWDNQDILNKGISKSLENLKDTFTDKLNRLENKISWFMGGLAVLVIVLQILTKVVF
jgi:hypothetical protein